MPYLKKSVLRPEGNPGRGITPLDRLTLIDVEDIAYFPSPNDKGVLIEEDIILKPGKYGIDLYLTPGTAKLSSPAEGETDQVGFTPQIEGNHPGNKLEVREFKVNNINTKFIAIMSYCNGQDADLLGTPCNPLKMVPNYTGDKDGNTNAFTFSQINKGEDIFIYRGAIPKEEPVAKLDSGVTKIDYIASGLYQLSDGAGTIAQAVGGSDGALITLVGAYGENPPSVTGGETILLRDGKPFIASGGSQLTLRAFRAGDGKVVWVEQSRYEAS